MRSSLSSFFNTLFVVAIVSLSVNMACADAVTDWYRLTMRISVPRVYDNTQSLGYRRYQRQKITGYLSLTYDTEDAEKRAVIGVSGLENQSHRIDRQRISYDCTIDEGTHFYPRVNAIGNNYTGEFNTPSIVFYMDAEPSYNVGQDDEDNSLLLVLSGSGKMERIDSMGRKCRVPRKFKGQVAGTLGCGCRAYGHVSPTRTIGIYGVTDEVDDVASVFGTWKAKRITRNGGIAWFR